MHSIECIIFDIIKTCEGSAPQNGKPACSWFRSRPIRRPFLPGTAVIANIAFPLRNRNSKIRLSAARHFVFSTLRFHEKPKPLPLKIKAGALMFVQWAPPSKPRVARSKNEVSTPLSGSDIN